MIQTYSDLQTAVGDFLNRQDLMQTCKTFIQFAESDLNRKLRVRDMVAPGQILFTTSTGSLPVDFEELKGSPTLVSNGKPLAYKTPEELSMALADTCLTGDPVNYTIIGKQMQIAPAPVPVTPPAPTAVQFYYYAQIPSLTQPTDSNWLLVKHPDLYLYSSLLQSAPYLKDDERLGVWGGLRQQIISDIEIEEERSSYRGAAPRVNVRHAIG